MLCQDLQPSKPPITHDCKKCVLIRDVFDWWRTHHWQRHMGAWQIVRIRVNKKTPLSQTWAIDWDWSRSCGCVSTLLGTIGSGFCRALYRRANF
jgi:hypothetical protein